MKARATATVEAGSTGTSRLVNLRSAAPLLLRSTPHGLYLVGGAAGPLGGDELELDLDVGPGASLTLRTSAASVALPGSARGAPSTLTIRAQVATGGTLRWLPEPTVAAYGCTHVVHTEFDLEAGCRLEWREEVILGRQGEAPGSWRSEVTADLDRAPLLRNTLALGPGNAGWDGSAVVGPAKAAGSLLLVDPTTSARTLSGDGWAALPLAEPAVLVTAVGDDALQLRARLEEAAGGLAANRLSPCWR